MSRWVLVVPLAAALCFGCKGKTHDGEAPPPEAAPVDAPVQVEPPIAPTPPVTPASLYAECHDRMELPEADKECTVDADCATAGCGKEVCTTVKGATEIMSTCEDKLCFKAVDTCGCHEGKCSWTLKAELPPITTPLPNALPPSLPPTGKPADPAAPPADPAAPPADPAAPAPAEPPKTP